MIYSGRYASQPYGGKSGNPAIRIISKYRTVLKNIVNKYILDK